MIHPDRTLRQAKGYVIEKRELVLRSVVSTGNLKNLVRIKNELQALR
jgi:hypothetical protein